MGGFVGYSTTVDSANSGQSVYTKCAANVVITGNDWRLGGFVGSAEYGKYDRCVSTGKITSTVTVNFNTKIGGFMGESDYAVADKCHTISKVISASTHFNPGGFVGYIVGGTFTDCSFDNESNDNMDADGTGKSLSGIEGYKTNIVLANICEDYYDGHKYAADWISDGANHWNECTVCKEKFNKSAHTYKWITDKGENATQAGSHHEKCTVCGYVKAVETIISPRTGASVHIWLWFALLFISGGGLLGTTACRRKRKETEN